MKKINVGRVLLGGFVAGVALNIGESILNGVLLAKSSEEELKGLGLSAPGGGFIAKAVVMTFILGFIIVFTYAAIRTQFGPGVKTAVCAGLLSWFCVYVYVGVIQTGLGFVSSRLALIGAVWGLVEYSIGAVAGAWLYKEAEA
ncbi:MAG TPA: hypothetical protein VJ810_29530 [Blastocatellia bacterium]|nr:hypothetical protein [Blastocatellia bacterium]